MTDDPTRLVAVLADIERHVGEAGWDQPARLFALVTTSELLALEPQLAGRVPDTAADAMTAVEQDGFVDGSDLLERLGGIFWPDTVEGAAIALERTLLPSEFEAQIPADPDQAADFVSNHPQRVDVRVVVGVLREGTRHGLARIQSNPDDLLGGVDLVPGLAEALQQTFEESHES
ncbi:MAG: PPA1309 family protein [Arachnia sp.]